MSLDKQTSRHVGEDDRNKAARALARKIPSALDRESPSRYRDNDGRRTPTADGSTGIPSSEEPEVEATNMRRTIDLGEQLRKAMRRSGLTRNQIARQADLSYAVVHGFFAGTKDLRLSTASKIAGVVGIEFRKRKRADAR